MSSRGRGPEPEQVLDHALRAVEHGLAVDLAWFLSPAQIAAIEAASLVGREPPERIRPLLARLPKEIRYEHVQLLRLPFTGGQIVARRLLNAATPFPTC